MRVLVTGGRKFDDANMVVNALCQYPPDTVVVHGGALGADALAAWYWAGIRQLKTEVHYANWPVCEGVNCTPSHRRKNKLGEEYCPTAGPLRNQKMLESGVDLLIAFPGGTGTEDMRYRALKAGIPVVDAVTGEKRTQ